MYYDESDSIVSNSLLTVHMPITTFDLTKNNISKNFQRFRNIYHPDEIHFSRMNIPATSVIIIISSSDYLKITLFQFENSIWWNHNAKFLIMNFSVDGCKNAYAVLSVVWTFRILKALYLCMDQDNQIVLYTFNPFSASAPTLWEGIASPATPKKDWTLLQYRFTNGK